jgi:hypothetical protein
MSPEPRSVSRAVLWVAAAAMLGACSSGSTEGGSCNRANGNADCASGLVCLSSLDVAAKTSVCCPRPPATSSVAACAPANQDFQPDPHVDAAPAAGGSGGSGGQEAGEASGGAPPDSGSDATGGTAGAAPDASHDGGDAQTQDAASDAADGG